MRNVLGEGTILGYCTNVHAGANASETLKNLVEFAPAIKSRVAPKTKMGIGLWFSKRSAMYFFQEICEEKNQSFGNGFKRQGLVPFTMNGFPMGNFHSDMVKHRVYEPDWSHEDRWGYTILLASIHAALAGDEARVERSISTLPIGWRGPPCKPVELDAAADRLLNIAAMLNQWHENSGLVIHIDLEPEPGCILQSSADVVRFFKENLLQIAGKHSLTEDQILRHIRVCHDICHAAVMFEDQRETFARYCAAGIKIGKVQVSNAVRVDFRNFSDRERDEAIAQLRQFSEDRYLHQTMIQSGDQLQFFEDLPLALQHFGKTGEAGDEWRVHFHVPVYLEEFGLLKTTRDYIVECMTLLKGSEVKHWEVETYAWNVLPKDLKVTDLAEGIAREMMWVCELAKNIR